MSDYLADKPVVQVAGWYRRLARVLGPRQIHGQEPLSSRLLNHWLDNRDARSLYRFSAPGHLRGCSYLLEALRHHRRVFLTEDRAHDSSILGRWGGTLPRLQGRPGFTRWNPLNQPMIDLSYESLVELPMWVQLRGTEEDKDLFASLHGFQLRSEIKAMGLISQPRRQFIIVFVRWSARVRDRYDWDYREHLTVPNPDFGSTASDAIAPAERAITVYHRNAGRLERAGLAAPYDLETDPWEITDTGIRGNAIVDGMRQYDSVW